jgi:Flp pilus assembly protein TadG
MIKTPRDKSVTRRRDLRTGLASKSGVAAIEFAILAPILLLIVTGACQFTMVLGNYMTLEHAAGEGARALAISRGDSTPVTDSQTQIYSAAGNLTTSNITINYSVNGTSCTTDASCSTALSAGVPAQVTATYPCNLVVMGTDFAPGCMLSVGATERVE